MYFLIQSIFFSCEDDIVTEAEFVNAFSTMYKEDATVTAQFFHSMDMTGDGLLEEVDFILQVLSLDPNRKCSDLDLSKSTMTLTCPKHVRIQKVLSEGFQG